uniref:DUF1758 domain-containing protein n=1 Tax=Haemonchus contortus TaxID=6289 RepID=A0A7I4YWZ2_HAECO
MDVDRALSDISTAETKIKKMAAAFEAALYAFTDSVDHLETPLNQDEEQKVSEHIEKAQELISRTEETLLDLLGRKQEILFAREHRESPEVTAPATKFELPRIAVPEFTGKAWQWDNFWELYNSTVHSQPLSDLQKFNYLLRSLKEDARESIARYQVTSANYGLAIDHLKSKYGRTSEIVTDLHRKLEKWTARSEKLKDQRKLLEQLMAITSQLTSKGQNLDNPWLISKVLSKFSENIQRQVLKEKVSIPEEEWTMGRQLRCLDEIIRQEEQIEEQLPTKPEKEIKPLKMRGQTDYRIVENTPFCFYCNGKNHWSTQCMKISDPKQRLEHLKATHKCINCGSQRHTSTECKSSGCKNCGKKHHTSICFKTNLQPPDQQKAKEGSRKKLATTRQNVACFENDHEPRSDSENTNEEDTNEDNTVLTVEEVGKETDEETRQIFLLSGVLRTKHPRTGNFVEVSVLLDTGADRSFIEVRLAQELDLPNLGTSTMKVSTFGARHPTNIECMKTQLRIWDSKENPHDLRLYAHSVLTKSHMQGTLDTRDLKFIRRKRINLCVPRNGKMAKPQVILGCDQLWRFIKFESTHFKLPSGLLLIPTLMGYMVSGTKILEHNESPRISSSVNMLCTEDGIDPWEEHWAEENISHSEREFSGPEKEEKEMVNAKVMENFNNSIEKRKEGYFVGLPFKEKHDFLPDNKVLALKRLEGILRSYKDQPEVIQQYHEVFQDQLRKHILEEVDETKDACNKRKHYLPHQPIVTPHKDTTKFRIVFDASAHYKDRPSLNDIVHQGPTILPKIYGILLRFRVGKYVLLSDVEKAFLQVHLHEDDRDVTRCLWPKDISKPLSQDNLVVYRFTRVTFGINASPFLLSGTILYHINHFVENQTLAEEIAANLYVDNLFVTADSVDEANAKYKALKDLFKDININLRAFVANDPDIMENIAEVDKASSLFPKVLGIPWNSLTDEFEPSIKIEGTSFVSKRNVAKQIASIYDPLGWFIPVLIKPKIFQQNLWKEHYDWDEPLKKEQIAQWKEIMRDLHDFHKRIPRQITVKSKTCTIVTYSDASALAMAACTYFVTDKQSYFLMAKSKLADSKRPTTTPKMEINAITIGARLTKNIYLSLKHCVVVEKIILLSDSEIALKWLQNSPEKRGVGQYVLNRVKEVHKIALELESQQVQVQFGYVDTKYNPADCATRGTSSKEFAQHLWWKGYSLDEIFQGTFISTLFSTPHDNGEEEHQAFLHTSVEEKERPQTREIINLSSYNSYTKVRRIMAYILRFLRNIFERLQPKLKNKLKENCPWIVLTHERFLSAKEIEIADLILIRNHQKTHFSTQYKKELNKNLNVKMDKDQVLRAYGRLNKSDLQDSAKNPIVVAPNSELSRLSGRYPRTIPQKCRSHNIGHSSKVLDSTIKRASEEHVGLDYFGPITVKDEKGNRSETYGCIFTCCVTRPLHLEVTPDGTTQKFLNAFRRFVARRGRPQSVTCDNAPIFRLGDQILNNAITTSPKDNEEITREMSDNLIEWNFITPYSPWKGGFYERLIQSVKQALTKTIGKRVLTMELLQTLLTEIEGCLNTRPLTYQESNLDDNIYTLRPIDFLQRDMNITLPTYKRVDDDDDSTYLPPNEAAHMETQLQTIKALQSSQLMTEKYWTVWRDYYLTALREQHRLHLNQKQGCGKIPNEGDIVLVSDPLLKRNHWKLAKVTKTVKSQDGAVREAEILCGKRLLRRPVNQLYPLEIEGNSEDTEKCHRKEEMNYMIYQNTDVIIYVHVGSKTKQQSIRQQTML